MFRSALTLGSAVGVGLLLAGTLVFLPPVAATPALANTPCSLSGGYTSPSGWGTSPRTITSEDDLIYLSLNQTPGNLSASYLLTRDLDLASCLWTPIGAGSLGDPGNTPPNNQWFAGVFDGGNYRIDGLAVNSSAQGGAGLFGSVRQGGTVRNLTVSGSVSGSESSVGGVVGLFQPNVDGLIDNVVSEVTVVGRNDVGGLVGYADGSGSITNSRATGSVTSSFVDTFATVGGLVGGLYGVAVSRSLASGSVTSAGDCVGGLVGYAGGPVTLSGARGDVTARNDVGGLAGCGDQPISYSFASGDVEGVARVGGLVGGQSTDSISNSYASGSVRGVTQTTIGALVGEYSAVNNPNNTISRTYARGLVTGSDDGGGLVGRRASSPVADVTASFWDTVTTGESTSDGGEGQTTAAMTSRSLYSSASWTIVTGWAEFSTVSGSERIWGICPEVNEGYPFLLWEFDQDTNPCSDTGPEPDPSASSATGKVAITPSGSASATDQLAATGIQAEVQLMTGALAMGALLTGGLLIVLGQSRSPATRGVTNRFFQR